MVAFGFPTSRWSGPGSMHPTWCCTVRRRAGPGAGVTRWHLSLTHTDTVALAVVVADRLTVPVGPAGS